MLGIYLSSNDSRYEQNPTFRPMSFDRVCQKIYSPTSHFPVFSYLPVELYGNVTNNLPFPDLKALALVDSDCRQLSIPSLFCVLKFNNPHHALHFFRFLSHTLHSSLIKSSIRSFIFNWKSTHSLDQDARQSLGHIFRRLANDFPNLRTLHWDSMPFNVMPLAVRNLRMADLTLRPDSSDSVISLETLRLDLAGQGEKGQDFHVLQRILCNSSETLRQLVITGRASLDDIVGEVSFPTLPYLLSLVLRDSSACSIALLSSLFGISTRVRSFAIETTAAQTVDFISERGYTCTLKEFGWLKHNDSISCDGIIEFIDQNTQLESLTIRHPLSSQALSERILPTLQIMLCLTTLHLVWKDSTIPEDNLRTIASIHTLQNLCLSVGPQEIERSTWHLDHDVIVRLLAPLTHLRILAFSKDSYQFEKHPLAPSLGDYYFDKALPSDVDILAYGVRDELETYQGMDIDIETMLWYHHQMTNRVWEKWHAGRMEQIATRYAHSLPDLSKCFVGQLSFSFNRFGAPSAVSETSERDPNAQFIAQMFFSGIWTPT